MRRINSVNTLQYAFLIDEAKRNKAVNKILVSKEIRKVSSRKLQSKQLLDVFSERLPTDQYICKNVTINNIKTTYKMFLNNLMVVSFEGIFIFFNVVFYIFLKKITKE